MSTDLNINFPVCENGCVSLKKKIIELYFNTRSQAIATLNSCKKNKKFMYGTCTNKKRKV